MNEFVLNYVVTASIAAAKGAAGARPPPPHQNFTNDKNVTK